MPEQIPLMVDAVTQELRQFAGGETIPQGQLLVALQVALTGLVTSDVSGVLESDTILQALGKLQAQASNKVDKVAGKQLSTEDFTSDDKTKLSGIAAGATANANDEDLRDRTTHTGAQSISTVEGLQDALNLKAEISVVGQAIAMASTFTTVPTTFQAWVIAVTQPHFRMMQWNGTKYIRAPWHQPGTLRHAYRGLRPGELQVRGDVTLNKSDFPDLAEYLGVTGSTFVLDEARAEFIRNADSGRGKDTGRTIGSYQEQSIQSHRHSYMYRMSTVPTAGGVEPMYGVVNNLNVASGSYLVGPTGGDETRPGNLSYILAVTY